MKSFFRLGCFASCLTATAADLSPTNWPAEDRQRAEALEKQPPFTPKTARVVEAKFGLVAATLSPIANQAGIETLKQGGTAADAAIAVALTQVALAAGSYSSYAGTLQLLYYEAKTAKVHSLNAPWRTYRGETDPKTIPNAQALDAEQGRKTLVPGFMAGIEAMHRRFGALHFGDLFAPAIWYCENGFTVSPLLAGFFASREKVLARTPEGKAFLHAGDRVPIAGDRFVQRDVANLLRSVAKDGARSMYTGSWGREFVSTVQRAGGKVTAEDMGKYAPIWEDPLITDFAAHTICAPGRSSRGGVDLLQTLNLIEELKIDRMPPYWRDPQTFIKLAGVIEFTQVNAFGPEAILQRAQAKGVNLALANRATKAYAKASLPLLHEFIPMSTAPPGAEHTDAVVVIDEAGNIATLVHTINTILWGSAGLVVQGVPLPDPAGAQQHWLTALKPGDVVPNGLIPVLVMSDAKPTLAIAAVGAALHPETVRLLLATLANRSELSEAMTAPPLLHNSDFSKRGMLRLPSGRYDAAFVARVRAGGMTVQNRPPGEVASTRGTAIIGRIDATTGFRSSVEEPGIFGFVSGY
jgi:gamma-glutamyltranspeptidase/glutathione hydrolase